MTEREESGGKRLREDKEESTSLQQDIRQSKKHKKKVSYDSPALLADSAEQEAVPSDPSENGDEKSKKGNKKSKKEKRRDLPEAELESVDQSSSSPKDKVQTKKDKEERHRRKEEKKKDKKKKRKQGKEAMGVNENDVNQHPVSDHPEKTSKTATHRPPPVAQPPKPWNDWNQVSFAGDEAKRSKFLRLLGHNADSSAVPSQPGSHATQSKHASAISSYTVAKKIEHDMLNLYETSRAMMNKKQSTGRRGGIGSG